MNDKVRLDALKALILQELEKTPARPKLRLIGKQDFEEPPIAPLDPESRAWLIARIHDLRKIYGLDWLIRQQTQSMGSLASLEDADLRALHMEVERARECLAEGISLQEAGFI